MTAQGAGRPRRMLVAGVMSGTSADGVDVALVDLRPGRVAAEPRMRLVHHAQFAYPPAMRRAVLAAMDAESTSVAMLARLNWRLGAFFADCVEQTCAACGQGAALVGLHGQTLFHGAQPARFLHAPVRATWQTGEPAVLAERLRIPVISDFRPADLAAGGQGAPLVPMLDFCLFRSPTRHRVLLNLGGIANLSALRAGGSLEQVLAFDVGPANMVMDALMQRHFGRPYDRDGRVAARGTASPALVASCLRDRWFAQPPPKSCGREQFGQAFAQRFEQRSARLASANLVASAGELTVAAILDASTRFVAPHLGVTPAPARPTEWIVSGGGARNHWLMARLAESLGRDGVTVRSADETALPAQAKEAAAFALLAWLSWHGLPGNVPAATGAARAVVLGKLSRA